MLGNQNFQPPFKFCMQLGTQEGSTKMPFFKGRNTLVASVTTAACSRPGVSFSYKDDEKNSEMFFLYLKLNTTLQIGTSTLHSNIIRLYIDLFNFPWE